jgi:DNA polymerase-3 subunit delta'
MNSFALLVGQNRAVELLTQAVIKDRIAPGYLFVGANGVGKKMAARCFVELVFCAAVPAEERPLIQKRLQQGNHPDLLWVEPTYLHQGQRLSAAEAATAGVKRKAPPQIRIEQVREIAQFLSRPPLEAKRSLVVIDQAETMAESAANALLKTLEEPGPATLILIAPSVESLLPTLVSRCQRIPFYGLDPEGMRQVLTANGGEQILEQPEILALAQGSPGEAIASWQQLQSIPPNLLELVRSRPQTTRQALEIARQVDKTLDLETQLWLLNYLQHCYWEQYRDRSAIDRLERARQDLLSYAQPRLVWECLHLAMLENAKV